MRPAKPARPTRLASASGRLAAGISVTLLAAACSDEPDPVGPGEAVTKQIVFTSDRTGDWDIWVMNEDGTGRKNLSRHPAQEHFPAWSPDGSRIAFTSNRDGLTSRDGNTEIYVMDANGSNPIRLSNDPSPDTRPTWSPDGRRIAFTSFRDGEGEIYVMNADGTGVANLTNHPARDDYASWSPDGAWIAFSSLRDATGNGDPNTEIYRMRADGSDQERLTDTPLTELGPSWSPDGTRIVFYTFRQLLLGIDLPGDDDIYVINADGTGRVAILANPGEDYQPKWSAHDRIVFTSNRPVTEVWTMDSDGSNFRQLTENNNVTSWEASWAP